MPPNHHPDVSPALIALTGASGFIGRHLCQFLLNQGLRIRVLLHHRDLPEKVEKFRGDLTREEGLDEFLKGTDTLFHMAAALGSAVISQDDFFSINLDGTRNLLKAAARQGVKKVVHVSSAGVYGQTSGLNPLKENDQTNPRDPYEKSKLAGETQALSFAPALKVMVVRPGWVYGPGDRRTFKLIKQIKSGFFFVAGSGRVKHSPIHVSDLVRGMDAIAQNGRAGEIYNVAGDSLSVQEMVEGIARILGKKIFPLHIPIGLLEPPAWLLEKCFSLAGREAPLSRARLAFFKKGKSLDCQKIKKELHFQIQIDFSDGITEAISWYRTQAWF